MTLYLKYRPQKISELDLKLVRERLEKMLDSGKDLPHAWLFSGSRGTGKTSAARILAKAINCKRDKRGKGDKGGNYEPCNECETCKSVTEGSAADVIEIDAASNRGIDEIRELRERVGLAPMQAKFKVYIIDEAHMLTNEAANALLKTLEEPPAHSIFILCTTEAEKLPETVRSRCAEVKFAKPSVEEIVEKLEKVAKAEGFKVQESGLKEIAKAARGSFRDAIKLLEQVILDGGDVGKVIDSTDPVEFLEMSTDIALKFVGDLVEKGVNLRGFVEKCVEVLREKLLETRDVSLITKIEGLERAYERMKTSAVVQLPLEIFVIENFNGGVIPTEAKAERRDLLSEPKAKVKEKERDSSTSLGMTNRGGDKLDQVISHWAEVMAKVKPMNHSVEALLRSTRPVDFDGRDLVLEAFYEFHKKQLESERCRVIVEQAVGEVMGGGGIVLKMQLSGSRLRQGSGEPKDDELVKAAEEIFR
ncbi:MAG: Uncharacterized protein G01um101416_633 [Microgenomates group bacterium Gr01-1014_16]|nr:MAG: Uncharacterized protein G01um101416_633 [Microgenomates group bacterium Gr01-1014_16]